MTTAAGEIVRSERLDLQLMEPDLLDALIDDHRAAIDAMVDYDIPTTFPRSARSCFARSGAWSGM